MSKWKEFKSVLRTEYGHIFTDAGVVLVLVFAMLIYGTLYSLAYRNEVLRDIPIAVVDQSRTASSRQLVSAMDAAPNINVAFTPADMDEARRLFFDRTVGAVVYIPADYEQKLMRGGEQIKIGVYVDASYFLTYRQAYSDIASVIVGTGAKVNYVKLLASGADPQQAQTIAQPVKYASRNLYNPYLGYGTFVMPAILIVIIQQTLLIGLGMIGGTWREFGTYRRLTPPGERRLSTIPFVLGKTAAYLSIYAVTMLYIFGIHYRLFHFPMNAPFLDITAFLTPYVLACIFLGIAVSTLFVYRENSLLYLLWTSIPILLLSGACIPREAMPLWMYDLGRVFPSSSAVGGFVRMQTMGAGLGEVRVEFITLWVLCGAYFILACLGARRVMNKVMK